MTQFSSLMGIRIWLVTSHKLGREILADRTSYSTDIRPYVGKSGADDGDIGGLGFTDPPEHTRLRKFVNGEFTRRRLARMQPIIERIVDEQLDVVAAAGCNGATVDLVDKLAFDVPFLVICDLLGLPVERREEFRQLSAARFDISGGGYAALGAISGSREFLLAETARQRRDPGPGLIGQIIREHGDEVNDFDLGGLADGVFTGGMETSAGMLALGSVVLLDHPDQWKRLAVGELDIDRVVEELLRLLSVVQVAFPRFAKSDVEVAGLQVRKGDVILVHIPAVNHDPDLAQCPHAFDPERAPTQHLAFGHGIHRCVGAELARMELRTTYAAMARRFPAMHLAVDSAEIGYREKSLVFGVDSVPVRTH